TSRSPSNAFTNHPSGGISVRMPTAARASSAAAASASRMNTSMSFSVGGPPRAQAAMPPARANGTSLSRSAAAVRFSASSKPWFWTAGIGRSASDDEGLAQLLGRHRRSTVDIGEAGGVEQLLLGELGELGLEHVGRSLRGHQLSGELLEASAVTLLAQHRPGFAFFVLDMMADAADEHVDDRGEPGLGHELLQLGEAVAGERMLVLGLLFG